MSARDAPFAVVLGGLKLRVRVTPRAGRTCIAGIIDLPGSGPALKAAVTAPAEGGKANEALLKLLAKTWRLPKTSLSVTAGKSARTKTVHIEGDPDELQARLAAWLRGVQ